MLGATLVAQHIHICMCTFYFYLSMYIFLLLIYTHVYTTNLVAFEWLSWSLNQGRALPIRYILSMRAHSCYGESHFKKMRGLEKKYFC